MDGEEVLVEALQTTSVSETVRRQARSGQLSGQTAGFAPDFLQGNVVILPKKYACDFLLYCSNNPKPCPIIGMAPPGSANIPTLGTDLDIRTDIPKYRLYEHGKLICELRDISDLWSADLVTFVLGCSFSFEEALMREGYPVRHIELGSIVPMFKTNIETMPGGIFNGPMVVTMRSFPEEQIPAVFDLAARYPHAHGTPIFWGDPEAIGIADLQSTDYGESVDIPNGEIPVFWACGVTPQAAIKRAQPDLCITHAPGSMLVTDVPSAQAPAVDVSLSRFWPTGPHYHR